MKLLAFALFLLGCVQSSAASEFQVEALYEMRMQLTHTRGVLNDWKDNQMSPCYWNNVICQDNKVTEITLSSSGLTGVLSPSIAQLTTLQQLLLDGNSITGGIPQEFGNLSSLTTLNLGRNNLTGSIPDSLGRLLKLQKLDLSQNLLSGNIPISLTQLVSLSDINLAYNNLSGEMPEALIQVAQYNYTGNHWDWAGKAFSGEGGSAWTGRSRNLTPNVILVTIGGIVALFIIGVFSLLWWQRMRYRPEMYIDVSGKRCLEDISKVNVHLDEALQWGIEGSNSEFTYFGFLQILEATKNFSVENKLGQGGFGPVYKGQFPDGLEIAVKRLASHSGQGFREFKNEVQLIAKLQHRNLVRLLGCCSQGEEKMLIYEYLPNKSLDFFLFEETRSLLNWNKRLMIIDGIAQGLLYLHKYSRLRVIHRDVKASNILLDSEMKPKISDFGLAKMCSSNDTEGNTKRVVGTYGYMAPEYASEGIFSTKSDVFSYGVLILEIITGKRNSGFHQYEDFLNLLGYAWQLWREGRGLELVDASLAAECQNSLEMIRCINIALLCVQENAVDRPSMSDVVAMLSNQSMTLSEPKHPAYFHVRVVTEEASAAAEPCSANEVTISSQRGR